MLLSYSFCKDLGGGIQMDWSHPLIPVDRKKVCLNPEFITKFIVHKSSDPRADILFIETRLSTYMCTSTGNEYMNLISLDLVDELWTLEFDGSYSTIGSRVGIVLISLDGYSFPFDFKLEFENMNNTTKYEALLL